MKTQFPPYHTAPIIKGSKYNEQKPNQKASSANFAETFRQCLQQEGKNLTISKHAKERLQQRSIHIEPDMWAKVEERLTEARRMGVKDSLILLDNAALIASAKNNVVITAMDRNEAVSQIFTNINGTIIID